MPKKKQPVKFNLDRWVQAHYQHSVPTNQLPEAWFKDWLSRMSKRANATLMAALPPDITGNDFERFNKWLSNQAQTRAVIGATLVLLRERALRDLCLDARGRFNPTKVQIACHGIGIVHDEIYGDDWSSIIHHAKRGLTFHYGPKKKRTDDLSREIERIVQTRGLKTRAREIWFELRMMAQSGHKTITEVTGDEIAWNGRTTSFGRFQNRVSAIKKRLRSQKTA
jgi:hypothetical protein